MTGAELAQRRKALGMTQQQLAERWQTYQPTISLWEGLDEIPDSAIIDDALRYLEGKAIAKRYEKERRR